MKTPNKTKTESAPSEAVRELNACRQMSEARRKSLQICVHALMDVQKAYQDMFDVMPVAWQTYDDMVSSALEQAGVLNAEEASAQ